jgi:hypothetical protein
MNCYLLIRKRRNVLRARSGVLCCETGDIAALIEIQNSVFVQILRFGYLGCLELVGLP